MNIEKIAHGARIAVKDFTTENIIELGGLPSLVPAATFLLIEAFALAAAVMAKETESTIEEGMAKCMEAINGPGKGIAKNCYAFFKQAKEAEAKDHAADSDESARRIAADIIAGMKK